MKADGGLVVLKLKERALHLPFLYPKWHSITHIGVACSEDASQGFQCQMPEVPEGFYAFSAFKAAPLIPYTRSRHNW
ncbi:MAG TPA: hypothetical protein VFA32_19985, partial [Dehalococcoidia bacterium]|nr:hypothetical protein [Dehalococcoidia bacterium]